MTAGFFHYKDSTQVLTVYYKISPSEGTLKFSCSLWKRGFKTKEWTKGEKTFTRKVPEMWVRKAENAHAKENFDKEFVTHKFSPFEQGDLKLDDIWLKKYIHKHICENGRKSNEFISHDIQKNGYKTIEQCYEARGHEYSESDEDEKFDDGYESAEDDEEFDDRYESAEDEEMSFLESLVKWWYS